MDRAAPYGQAARIVPAQRPARPRITFSAREFLHLAAGVLVLTYAFAILNDGRALPDKLVPDPWTVLAAFLAVTTGFVLHELAHKVAAQRYGHWAEFRATLVGLVLALAMAPFGMLVALPGATWIRGNVTRSQSGVISVLGPAVNFVIAWAAFPLSISVNPNDPMPVAFRLVAQVNAFLAAFNLLPLPFFGVPLDGLKVLRWNVGIWIASFLAAAGSAVFITLKVLGIL